MSWFWNVLDQRSEVVVVIPQDLPLRCSPSFSGMRRQSFCRCSGFNQHPEWHWSWRYVVKNPWDGTDGLELPTIFLTKKKGLGEDPQKIWSETWYDRTFILGSFLIPIERFLNSCSFGVRPGPDAWGLPEGEGRKTEEGAVGGELFVGEAVGWWVHHAELEASVIGTLWGVHYPVADIIEGVMLVDGYSRLINRDVNHEIMSWGIWVDITNKRWLVDE